MSRWDIESKTNRTWEDLTGHEAAFHNRLFSRVYDYDPADDGPEVEVITRILASHPCDTLLIERLMSRVERRLKRMGINV